MFKILRQLTYVGSTLLTYGRLAEWSNLSILWWSCV